MSGNSSMVRERSGNLSTVRERSGNLCSRGICVVGEFVYGQGKVGEFV